MGDILGAAERKPPMVKVDGFNDKSADLILKDVLFWTDDENEPELIEDWRFDNKFAL